MSYEPTKEGRRELINDALEVFGSGTKIYVKDKRTGREWHVTKEEAEKIRSAIAVGKGREAPGGS